MQIRSELLVSCLILWFPAKHTYSSLSTTPQPPTNTTVAASGPMLANLNLDGGVDVLDVQLCVKVFLGTETDPGIVGRSDVNGNSAADVLDVQLVVNEFLGG